MRMKQKFIALALVATLFVGISRPASALFDKVRFATDLGVAFFAFHHFVQAPYKAGAFAKGAPHRTKALVKGGVALLFTVNRLKAANKIVHTTKDPALRKLGDGIDRLTGGFTSVGQRLKGGNFKPSDVGDLDGSVNSLSSGASA